uniref:Uncharacterized protein n=1 Tax=Timema poppense TaxID=170557 RepID=A0A7R9D4V3_TIMPO|nr:unnamed protein product [Timema poppensis]
MEDVPDDPQRWKRRMMTLGVGLCVSHSFLMNSNRTKPTSRDWLLFLTIENLSVQLSEPFTLHWEAKSVSISYVPLFQRQYGALVHFRTRGPIVAEFNVGFLDRMINSGLINRHTAQDAEYLLIMLDPSWWLPMTELMDREKNTARNGLKGWDAHRMMHYSWNGGQISLIDYFLLDRKAKTCTLNTKVLPRVSLGGYH